MIEKYLKKRPLIYVPFILLAILLFFKGGEGGIIPPMGYITLSLIALILSVVINNHYVAREVKIHLENQIALRSGELKESEARYKSLVNNIPGVSYRCLYDKNWTMLFISDEIERLTGYPARDFINNQKREFKSILHKDNPSLTNDRVAQALKSGKPYREEYRLVDKKGHVRWVLDKGTGLQNDKGEVLFIDGVMIDITEEKRLTRAKKELEEQYYQAQKMESIGRLAGGIAHDLNNLLTPVMGYADLLDPLLSDKSEAWEYAQEIIGGTSRAKDLVQQLLTYSRQKQVIYVYLDINSSLESFRRLLQKSLKENVKLVIKTDPLLPLIKGDQNQLEQVIMNLVLNAQDAMPQGGKLTIETKKKKDRALIHIIDTGMGMDEETIKHIYEPFYSTKGHKGTGLGLASVYNIVKQHDGVIQVKSQLEKGTHFIISLPGIQSAGEK